MRRTRAIRLGGGAFFLGVLIMLGIALPVYWVYLLTAVAIGALTARSVGLVTNQVGIFTLCQMSFAAIGGWVVSALALRWPDTPFPLLALCAGVVTAPLGGVLGLLTARIRGVELAVVTLGFATALDLVLRQGSFPGVGAGSPVIPAAPFDDPRWFFALAWTLLLLLQIAVSVIGRTRHGLAWPAVRLSERSAAALGVPVSRAKASAFGLGALLAGISGGLLAGQYGLLTPDVFTPLTSMVHLVTALLCGASIFTGAVLAGVLAVGLPELLRRLGLPLDLGNALLAFGAFDVLRRGNGGLAEQWGAWLEDRAFRGATTSCAPAGDTQLRTETLRAGVPPLQEAEPPALEVVRLTVDYDGHRALDAVDLRVEMREVHALIGPNGAGKSTLVDAVTGFYTVTSGTIRSGGKPMGNLTARARALSGIRRTFQEVGACEAHTVLDYLRLAAGRSGGDSIDRVQEYFGLPPAHTPVRLMDTGSRRILEVAGALVALPRVLLLDEPAAGLDDETSAALAMLVRRIPGEFGCSVVLVEHDMEFVRAAANRVTVLEEGRRLSFGSTAEVLAEPRVVSAYLGRAA